MVITDEQLIELKGILSKVESHIPDYLAGPVWNWYKKINNTQERQPCTCNSSAKLWRKAILSLRDFIKDK
tara:strand:- start:7016 stop:7225 length:210 start_codon:yes stop_codon:yes gene_type:complete